MVWDFSRYERPPYRVGTLSLPPTLVPRCVSVGVARILVDRDSHSVPEQLTAKQLVPKYDDGGLDTATLLHMVRVRIELNSNQLAPTLKYPGNLPNGPCCNF